MLQSQMKAYLCLVKIWVLLEIFDKTIKAVVDESDRKNIEQLFKNEDKMQEQKNKIPKEEEKKWRILF